MTAISTSIGCNICTGYDQTLGAAAGGKAEANQLQICLALEGCKLVMQIFHDLELGP